MRTGLLGALIDEYERALEEFIIVCTEISENDFFRVEKTNDRFKSIQDIIKHVCRAGFAYADFIREIRKMEVNSPNDFIGYPTIIKDDLRKMFDYTVDTVNGLYHLTEPEVYAMIIPVWGEDKYHLEQLLEHAIVHILRHRRQIEKILKNQSN